MDKETLIKYAPTATVVIAIILQWNLFVRPEQIEVKHREILKEVSEIYTTKEQYNDVKIQLNDMEKKIDKIYEKIIK